MVCGRLSWRMAAAALLAALCVAAAPATNPGAKPPSGAASGIAALAAAAGKSSAGLTLEQLTSQAAALEKELRTANEPAERKRLTEELERIKHQMGPVDSSGARIRCQAMWHDSALESLDQEIKRPGSRPGTLTVAGAFAEMRLSARRVARVCLAQGWRMADTPAKYQVDVFGAYLVNNSRTLDTLFDSVAAGLARELGDDAAAYQKAVAKARQGIARMSSAAEAASNTPSDQPEALVAAMGEFVGGLRAVRDANDLMRDLARKKGKAAPGAETEAAAGDAATPEPPPMTAAEKITIESIRRIMGRLKGEGWAYTVNGLERYVGAVENGFQLPIARPKARELLANLETLAALAEGLDASKAAYPEYVQMRQKQLEPVFLGMMDAESRPAAYARLDAMWKDDEFRRQVDAGGLPPASAQGLMRAFYDVVPRLLRDATDGAAPQGQAIRAACLAVAGLFEKATAGPPKDMTPALRDGYLRLQKDFRSEVEAAGAALPADTAGGVAKLTAAAGAAHGMDLLVRTDAALKAIAKHKVSRGQTLIAQALRLAQDMAIKQGAEAAAAAQTLELFIQSFEELGRFPMPEQDLARTVSALVGRAYGPASTALNQALGAGLDAAAGGDPVPLRQALAAQNMFGLLRRRAQAAAYHLDKAPTTNLATFSVPENVWSKFVPALDKKMQEAFAQYGSQGATRAPYIAAMAEWDYVYADVMAGVRMNLDGRLEGEADLDVLMRNLEHATLASPDRQAANLWAVGYHATEAAVSLAAGFDTVAAWHRNLMRGCDAALRTVDLAPAKREGRR